MRNGLRSVPFALLICMQSAGCDADGNPLPPPPAPGWSSGGVDPSVCQDGEPRLEICADLAPDTPLQNGAVLVVEIAPQGATVARIVPRLWGVDGRLELRQPRFLLETADDELVLEQDRNDLPCACEEDGSRACRGYELVWPWGTDPDGLDAVEVELSLVVETADGRELEDRLFVVLRSE